MGRLLIPICIGLAIGGALGWGQATVAHKGFDERFVVHEAFSSKSTESKPSQPEVAKSGEAPKADVAAKSEEPAPEAKPAETVSAVDLALKIPDGTPRVEIPGGTHYKFGTMMQGEEMSHEFKFRNIGKGPLKLEMKRSTCKCTVGELEKSVLQPGEETMVKLTWVAKASLPDFSQSATIGTSDPLMTEVQLAVSGTIGKSIVFEPPVLSLGDVSATETIKTKFQIFFYKDDVELKGLTWDEAATAELVEFTKLKLLPSVVPEHARAAKAYEVNVSIKPGLRMGPLNAKIVATTDLPPEKLDPLEISVTGRVTGEVELLGGQSFEREKQILTMGTVSSKVGSEMRVQLAVQGANRAEVKPEVVKVVPEGSLEVEIGTPREQTSRRLFPVVLRVPKGAPPANFPGTNPKNFGKVLIKVGANEIPINVRLIVEN